MAQREDETVGEILRRLRGQKRISLNRVAVDLEVNKAYLSRVENSLVSPSIRLLENLADLYKASRLDLLVAAGVLWLSPDIHPNDEAKLREAVDSGGVSFAGMSRVHRRKL